MANVIVTMPAIKPGSFQEWIAALTPEQLAVYEQFQMRVERGVGLLPSSHVAPLGEWKT